MSFGPYLDEALEIISGIKGIPQTLEERKRLSVDLAALLIRESTRKMSGKEKRVQDQLARLMLDVKGKAFTTAMTDQCFRSSSHLRIADQMIYLLHFFGVPSYLGFFKRVQLHLFKALGPKIARFLIPFATRALRKETSRVILPGEKDLLTRHLKERKMEGVRLNLNHLGEAILSEKEAAQRLQTYLDDLRNPDIDYMSVKISTIFSQIHLIAFDDTVEKIAKQLRVLYRAAIDAALPQEGGGVRHKFINLDMEEYRDLKLTVEAFKKVLEEKEFEGYSAGIVLQAYLPDSFAFQKELTQWAKQRVKHGGAPIKIRIVKGANLAMEQFEASVKGWEQAPYLAKVEVDANYKRMVSYGCIPENARAARIGVASHNLFDISFAILLRAENEVEPYVEFEMLEGMADHIRRAVQELTGDILLYCPIATKKEFQHAIAYLIRRLDENTGAENFLRHVFGLKPGSESWDSQMHLFLESCDLIETASLGPRREQNRLIYKESEILSKFENEPDTDFSLPQNQIWAKEIAAHWKAHVPEKIPLVIRGEERFSNSEGKGRVFSLGHESHYTYAKASREDLLEAIAAAKAYEKTWGNTSIDHRVCLLSSAAKMLRQRRGEFLGAMMFDTSKVILEADPEISEAIDFADYYATRIQKMGQMEDLKITPKGTIAVIPPWNFPLAIPAGGILASLATGNCVLFKPASDAVLVAWHLVQALWDAGIPKEALQFVPCSGGEVGSLLIESEEINGVVLTGGTATAESFLQMRPTLDLAAETGGKNSLIITALADRDLAIKDLIQSAFGHQGQKCSAASLAILEKEVYDDPHFLQTLKEAAKSLHVGLPWDLSTKISPLIHPPQGDLLRALTTLEEGEEWLLEPKKDPHNPALWSPGIKLHVKPHSFTHMTELFGPVLGLMRANNLPHAIELANAVPYGLTSGLHSLDPREQALWIEEIEAGNLYINRTTTGAIVSRQPFGGTKLSSFGNGSKAGGPNYLRELCHLSQKGIPQEKAPVNEWVNSLTTFLNRFPLSAEQLGVWTASVANYAYWWKRFSQDKDPTKIVGQDNFFRYVPRTGIVLRLHAHTHPMEALRVAAAALTVGSPLEISWSSSKNPEFNWVDLVPILRVVEESEKSFIERVGKGQIHRVRLLEKGTLPLYKAASSAHVHIVDAPVLANGRFELLHYLREVSISIDYHRYGNLGMREGELRKPIL